MIERGCGQHLFSILQDAEGHCGIPALGRDQLVGIVGCELIDEEEIGGRDSIAQQLDALANERSDGEKLVWRGLEASLFEEGLDAAAEFVDGQGADMLGVEPDSLGIERVNVAEVHHCVRAVDALESESRSQLIES